MPLVFMTTGERERDHRSFIPALSGLPTTWELSPVAHRPSAISLLFLEFGKCREKAGGSV